MIFSSALVVGRSDHHIRPLNFNPALEGCLNDVCVGYGEKQMLLLQGYKAKSDRLPECTKHNNTWLTSFTYSSPRGNSSGTLL